MNRTGGRPTISPPATGKTRIAIVGSRDWVQQCPQGTYPIKWVVSRMDPERHLVVSGGARGIDSLAVMYARKRGIETLIFPAEWDKYGKRAGFLRNTTIIENADAVVAFWDGKSRGTKDSIDKARSMGRRLRIIYPDEKISPKGLHTF